MKIEAILFDMDGVLIDSKEAWFKAFNEVASVSREEFEERYWGRSLMKNLDEISQEQEHFCNVLFPQYMDGVDIFTDTKEALDRINLPKALITNTTQGCTQRMLESHDLKDYFETVVTPDRAGKGKPAPDMIFMACDELGVKPEETVMVGDSEEDMEAGKKAGCMTVGIGVEGEHRINGIGELAALLDKLIS